RRDADGRAIELRCRYDPATRGGTTPDGRRVQGTLHWVSAEHALPAEGRLYDRLFAKENPDEEGDFLAALNPNSLRVLPDCLIEPALGTAQAGDRYQFERLGYFVADPDRGAAGYPVFNRTVTLRDTWAKIERKRRDG